MNNKMEIYNIVNSWSVKSISITNIFQMISDTHIYCTNDMSINDIENPVPIVLVV